MKENDEFEKFMSVTDKVLSVPRSAVKERLDAERDKKKRKKSRKSSASREPSDR